MFKKTILIIGIAVYVSACTHSHKSEDHSGHEMHSEEMHDGDMHGEHGGDMHAHHHEGMESMEVSGASLFNLESEWANQDGDSITLSQIGGKLKIISMVYTHCQFACPRIVADIKIIEEQLKEKGIENVQYVLVSIDPERDNPARLKEFAQENEFDDHWTLLTSSEDNVLELAVVLGVKYKVISDTDFSHSNLITVLSPTGEVIHRQEGLGAQPDQTIQAIIEANEKSI